MRIRYSAAFRCRRCRRANLQILCIKDLVNPCNYLQCALFRADEFCWHARPGALQKVRGRRRMGRWLRGKRWGRELVGEKRNGSLQKPTRCPAAGETRFAIQLDMLEFNLPLSHQSENVGYWLCFELYGSFNVHHHVYLSMYLYVNKWISFKCGHCEKETTLVNLSFKERQCSWLWNEFHFWRVSFKQYDKSLSSLFISSSLRKKKTWLICSKTLVTLLVTVSFNTLK